MRVRTLLIGTAIVSSVLGSIVAYLVLTVPNDIQAGSLLKSARRDVEAGRNDRARQELTRIVQQYPRTDAAAAATAALASISDRERHELESALAQVQREAAAQKKEIADLKTRVDTLAAAPPPPTPQPPPPEKKPVAKKKTPHKKKRHR